jgi:hypothetical protein
MSLQLFKGILREKTACLVIKQIILKNNDRPVFFLYCYRPDLNLEIITAIVLILVYGPYV